MNAAPIGADAAFGLERISFGTPSPRQSEVTPPPQSPDPVAGEEGAVEVVGKLAHSLAEAIVTAMRSLEEGRAAEREHGHQAIVERLASMQQQIEQLANMISEQKILAIASREKYQELVTEMEAVKEADAAQEVAASNLRQDIRDASKVTCSRLDELEHQVVNHGHSLASLKASLDEVPTKLDAVVQRLDRHADAIRGLCGLQEQRKVALNQLGEVLASLQGASSPAPENL